MSSNVRYSQIKNLADLKTERTRVDMALEYAKRNLSDDLQNADRMLSLESIVGVVTTKYKNLYSIANNALAGFNIAKMLVDLFWTKRR